MKEESPDRNEQTVHVTERASGIRPATVNDLDDLVAIDHQAVANDPERIQAIRTHVSDGCCWVLSGQAKLDGYAVLLPRHFFGRDFLDLLIVASYARRSGIATKLLRSLLSMEGTRQVFTSTNRSNAPMRELLAKEGWQVSGQLDGLDAYDPEMVFFTWRS
jgi:ribosomal protein S18 acetylase RimI-like enzyme